MGKHKFKVGDVVVYKKPDGCQDDLYDQIYDGRKCIVTAVYQWRNPDQLIISIAEDPGAGWLANVFELADSDG